MGRNGGILCSGIVVYYGAEYPERVVLITVQEIADSIRKSGKHNDWINEFEIKYGLNKQQMANTRYKKLPIQ